ncbi:hypothetical protein PF004_g30805 [Phytophthora fragariae]|uniref:Amino acid transporter transmembrane domain-containing protein n=1 Tax=Phytophthora fragariae TaxID=53985 RepID=A0A6G0MBU4_9STRA|nr:hypothetical protein PF004_g30805 [Phytophthora fragariae]
MPRVVGVTVASISCLFLVLAGSTYSAVGCQATGNLLYTMYPDPETGLTTLGFAPNWGAVMLTYLLTQLHITAAFAVILNPVFYIAERLALGMHKAKQLDLENPVSYIEAVTPNVTHGRSSKLSYVSVAEANHKEDVDEEMAEYRGGVDTTKYIVPRVVMIVILEVLAIVFRDHFSDFVDFIAASCMTLNCIVLPIVFYLSKTWDHVPVYEQIPAIIVSIVCTLLGCYVTYTTDKSAQEIASICTGVASDEAAPASLLLSKTAEQRYLIWWHYRIAYE